MDQINQLTLSQHHLVESQKIGRCTKSIISSIINSVSFMQKKNTINEFILITSTCAAVHSILNFVTGDTKLYNVEGRDGGEEVPIYKPTFDLIFKH